MNATNPNKNSATIGKSLQDALRIVVETRCTCNLESIAGFLHVEPFPTWILASGRNADVHRRESRRFGPNVRWPQRLGHGSSMSRLPLCGSCLRRAVGTLS